MRGEEIMFCPICGKEVPEGQRFCGACGYDTTLVGGAGQAPAAPAAGTVNAAATTGTVNTSAPAGGANVTAQADVPTANGAGTNPSRQKVLSQKQKAEYEAKLAQVERKLIASEKKTKDLVLIALVLLLAIPGFLLFKGLQNGSGWGTIVLLIFGVVPFYLYVYLVRAWLQISKRKLAEEYFSAISYRDFSDVADRIRIGAPTSPVVNDVVCDPNGYFVNVQLTGGKELQIKKDMQDTIVYEWLRGAADPMMLDTFIVNLAKQISPKLSTEIDEEKVNKHNKIWKLGEILSGCAIFIPVAVYMIVVMLNFNGRQYIEGVKSHVPDEYDISYETAFNRVFDNGEWKYFVADDESKVVEYAGTVSGQKIRIQWLVKPLDNGKVIYEYYTMELNEKPLNVREQQLVTGMIFENASGNGGNTDFNAILDDSSASVNSGSQLADNNQSVGRQTDSGQGSANQQSGEILGEYQSDVSKAKYQDLAGNWDDLARCTLYLERTGDLPDVIMYHATINWSSSAWETTVWEMDLEYDADFEWLRYSNAYCENQIYDDSGNVRYETVYTDGYGCFEVKGSDGILYWTSFMENDNYIYDKDFHRY